MARRILATAAAVSCASCAYYSQRVYMSDAAPEAAPPSPAELAVEKLQTMKQNYNLLTKEQLAKELTIDEFFLTLGLDKNDSFAQRIAIMADLDQSETITFDEYTRFAALLENDTLYASLIIDHNADGKVYRKDLEILIQNGKHTTSTTSTSTTYNESYLLDKINALFAGKQSIKVESPKFVTLLHLLEDDVLEQNYQNVAIDGRISASDLVYVLSDQGFVPSKKLTNAVFEFVQKQPTKTVSRSQFRALFKILRRVPQLERSLLIKKRAATTTAAAAAIDETKDDAGDAAQLTRTDLKEYLIQNNPNISNVDEATNICFDVFDNDRSNTLSLSELRIAHDNSTLSSGTLKKKPKMTTLQSLGIGAISGAAGSCVVFPIYKVKTRLQSIPSTDGRGAFAQASEIIKKEGFFNLYRGLQAELAGIGPVKASALFANDFFRNYLKDKNGKLDKKGELMSGVGTGLIVTGFYCPQEIVTIRMQMQGMPGVVDQTMTSIVKELGISGLYNGVGATALREVPFCVIHFSTYNWLKNNATGPGAYIPRDEQSGLPTNTGLVICGFTAGMVAAGLDTPADTIKTRLQNGKVEYKGIIDCAVKTWQTDGAKPFVSGVLPRMLMCGPKYGTIMFVKEFLQRYFFPLQDSAFDIDQEDFDIIRRGRVSDELKRARARYGVV